MCIGENKEALNNRHCALQLKSDLVFYVSFHDVNVSFLSTEDLKLINESCTNDKGLLHTSVFTIETELFRYYAINSKTMHSFRKD